MNEYNEQVQKHGPWKNYWSDGKLNYKGNYLNGQKHGPWEGYWSDGKLNYKGNYLNGKRNIITQMVN
jgi:antitoxin component YwqK of YwqJK toxin-antitoxin module